MKVRVETWNGHEIRFVEKEPGEWWAVAADVASTLEYRDAHNMARIIPRQHKDTHKVSTPGGEQEMIIVSEFGIYKAVFGSHKPEAEDFQEWVYKVVRTLRQASGLEGFQVFRMLDKEHQRSMMTKLHDGLGNPPKINYIKANTIADKAVSTLHGHPKMLKKDQMTPEMLIDRQPILEDTVELMTIQGKYGLALSVSDTIYGKYSPPG